MKRRQDASAPSEDIMRCRISNEELHSYLTDELTTERHIEIKTHLVQCRHCREIVDDLSYITEQLAELLLPAPRLASGRQLLNWSANQLVSQKADKII